VGREFVAHMMARMRVFMTVTTISGAVAVLAGIALYAAIWAGTGFMEPGALVRNGRPLRDARHRFRGYRFAAGLKA